MAMLLVRDHDPGIVSLIPYELGAAWSGDRKIGTGHRKDLVARARALEPALPLLSVIVWAVRVIEHEPLAIGTLGETRDAEGGARPSDAMIAAGAEDDIVVRAL
jgi:hypothetical protein